MIEAMGWRREDVYICNIVKCRPPGNRNPQPDEVATCEPFLEAQIARDRARARSSRSASPPISALLGATRGDHEAARALARVAGHRR